MTRLPALSEELAAIVKPVEISWMNKVALRLPSKANIEGTATSSDPLYEGLPLFATTANRIRRRKSDGVAVQYWLNYHTSSGSTYRFQYVKEDGSISNYDGSNHHTENKGVVLLCDV